jgi:hypothetical protein
MKIEAPEGYVVNEFFSKNEATGEFDVPTGEFGPSADGLSLADDRSEAEAVAACERHRDKVLAAFAIRIHAWATTMVGTKTLARREYLADIDAGRTTADEGPWLAEQVLAAAKGERKLP